ncbi:MAG: type VII secretion-associated protein [Mycobacterium sp.]
MDSRAVTAAVLIIGPGSVHGPCTVSDEKVCAAIDAIDDDYTLLDERPVGVDALWASIITEAAGDSAQGLTLVVPGWWSDTRVGRIQRAAGQHRGEQVVVCRHDAYRTPPGCILEIAPDFVLCRSAGGPVSVTPRLGDVAAEAARSVTVGGPVLIDAPVGVAGAAALAATIAGHLGGCGREVRIVDDPTLAAEVAARQESAVAVSPRRRGTVWALPMGALLTVGVLLGAGRTVAPPGESPTTLITEGRVTVRIPADWQVQRITSGAGSARIQAFPHGGEIPAILLTQSSAAPDPATTAAVLKAALEIQAPGVFTDFRQDDDRAGRTVLSYNEIRDGRAISWAVFVDGRTRIAIGCQQSRPGAETIRAHCDEAIRSAHASR